MKNLLVLRPREPMSVEQFEETRRNFTPPPGFNVLFVPYEFDVMTGADEPEPAQAVNEEATDADIAAARDEILTAYQAGKIVQYNPIADPLAGWIDCHRFSSPHVFEWNDNYYRFPPRK
jgi:hypothetical protein